MSVGRSVRSSVCQSVSHSVGQPFSQLPSRSVGQASCPSVQQVNNYYPSFTIPEFIMALVKMAVSSKVIPL